MTIGYKVGNLKNLKKTLKRGSGNFLIKWIPKGDPGTLLVRFLEEPDNWVNYNEHWDATMRASYPCIEDSCPGCRTGERRTSRYLANALDVETDKVVALTMPKDLTNQLVRKYERFDTLMDRDYTLLREGEGFDTSYDNEPEPVSRRKLTKYTLLDLQSVLDQTYENVFGGADDDEDEKPKRNGAKAPAAKRKSAAAANIREDDEDDEPAKPKKKSRFAPPVRGAEPEEDDEDDEEDEDVEDDDISLEEQGSLADDGDEEAMASLTELAEEAELNPDDYPLWSQLAEALSELEDEDDEDEDDDEEDDDDEDEEDDEDEDEDDDETDAYTEADLKAMPVGELRQLARDNDIDPSGKTKAALIEEMLDE